MTDGTFGTTGDLNGLDAETVDAVENHRFEPLKSIMWRNTALRFDSPGLLLKTLEERPNRPELMRVRDADDHLSLIALSRDAEIAAWRPTARRSGCCGRSARSRTSARC